MFRRFICHEFKFSCRNDRSWILIISAALIASPYFSPISTDNLGVPHKCRQLRVVELHCLLLHTFLFMVPYSHSFTLSILFSSFSSFYSSYSFSGSMDWSMKFLFTSFVIVAAAIDGAHGDAMVSGTVICDQCKDGQVSLFDYPLYGIKVRMACPGSDGQFTSWREETTNWFGSYAMRVEGTPNLSGCYTQVLGNGQGSSGCGAVAGPPQHLKLMFDMFDMAMYTVDPLLAQPADPMPFCPRSAAPIRLPPAPLLPPVPRLPPSPAIPFLEDSACPHQKWLMPEYRCYWKVVTPDTKVGVTFGLMAARRYGTDMTLGQGMMGRGDPYRTLLREGITALLNSYNSIQFPYHPLGVIQHMNWGLMGSTRQVLHTAWSFMKANAGIGTNATCHFTSCN